MTLDPGTTIAFDWGRADIERSYDDAAAHDLPLITLIGSALFLVFAVIDTLTHLNDDQWFRLLSTTIPGVAFLLISVAARRRLIRPRWAPWAVAGIGLVAVIGPLISVAHARHTIDLTFCMLIVVAVGACAYRYVPFIVVGVITGVAYIALALEVTSFDSSVDWISAYAMAFGLGGVLLAARRRSVREFAEAKAHLRHAAGHDALTALMNRHGLQTAGPTLLALARRAARPVFAAFVDIDGLSAINNTYGHGAGDEVIQTVAAALVHAVREADIVARWGGDEIVLVGIGEGPDAHRIEEAVRAYAIRHTAVPGWDGQVSVGVTTLPSVDTTFDALILTADAAMYERRGVRRGVA